MESSLGKNSLNREGVPTAIELRPEKPTIIRSIQGMVKLPEDHGGIIDLQFKNKAINLVCKNGQMINSPVHWQYLINP